MFVAVNVRTFETPVLGVDSKVYKLHFDKNKQ